MCENENNEIMFNILYLSVKFLVKAPCQAWNKYTSTEIKKKSLKSNLCKNNWSIWPPTMQAYLYRILNLHLHVPQQDQQQNKHIITADWTEKC